MDPPIIILTFMVMHAPFDGNVLSIICFGGATVSNVQQALKQKHNDFTI